MGKNMEEMHVRWNRVTKDGDEFLLFNNVANKRSNRADLHAFLLLDSLFPGNSDMVASASHDEIWLAIDGEQIEQLTDEQILELSWCGVRYDTECDSLCMFV